MKYLSTFVKLSVLIVCISFFSCQKAKQASQKIKQVKTEKKEVVAAKSQAPKPAVIKESPKNKYFLIAASFQNPKNAETFHLQLKDKGYDASILNAPNGFFRVSYKGFSQRAEAFKELKAARATTEHKTVWLHIKH